MLKILGLVLGLGLGLALSLEKSDAFGCPKRRAQRIESFKEGFQNLFHREESEEEVQGSLNETPPKVSRTQPIEANAYTGEKLSTTARINGGQSFTRQRTVTVQNLPPARTSVRDYTRQPIPLNSNPYRTN